MKSVRFCFKFFRLLYIGSSVVLLGLGTSLHAKVLIYTYAYNRPDFIEIQHKTFQKFLKDDYEFVVFDDGDSAFFLLSDVYKHFSRQLKSPS